MTLVARWQHCETYLGVTFFASVLKSQCKVQSRRWKLVCRRGFFFYSPFKGADLPYSTCHLRRARCTNLAFSHDIVATVKVQNKLFLILQNIFSHDGIAYTFQAKGTANIHTVSILHCFNGKSKCMEEPNIDAQQFIQVKPPSHLMTTSSNLSIPIYSCKGTVQV